MEFLPHDAMHKRGICCHAVSVCTSVRPSVCLSACMSRSWTLSKRINMSSNFFSPSSSHCHSILVFPTKRHGNIPTGTPLMGASNGRGVGKNRDSRPIGSMTAGHARNNCDCPPCSLSHRRRRISESCLSQLAAWTTMTKRRKENRI